MATSVIHDPVIHDPVIHDPVMQSHIYILAFEMFSKPLKNQLDER